MQATDYIGPDFSSAKLTRWEKHRVWVVEATLHPGNHNVLSKRRFYIDEDTGQAVLGEAYDADGNLAKCYFCPTRCSPTVPKVNPLCIVTYNLLTGDYLVQGQLAYGTYLATEYSAPQPETNFEAQQMAANASF
jgi:hypothetical protein